MPFSEMPPCLFRRKGAILKTDSESVYVCVNDDQEGLR